MRSLLRAGRRVRIAFRDCARLYLENRSAGADAAHGRTRGRPEQISRGGAYQRTGGLRAIITTCIAVQDDLTPARRRGSQFEDRAKPLASRCVTTEPGRPVEYAGLAEDQMAVGTGAVAISPLETIKHTI